MVHKESLAQCQAQSTKSALVWIRLFDLRCADVLFFKCPGSKTWSELLLPSGEGLSLTS